MATSVDGMESVIMGKILYAVDNGGDGIIIIISFSCLVTASRVVLHK